MSSSSSLTEQVHHELSLIRRDKLVAHCDIDSCFDQAGHLGTLYTQSKDKIIEMIKQRNHNGQLPARCIPTAQAYTQTRDLMERLYPHTEEMEIQRLSDQEWVFAATGIFLPLKERGDEVRPQKLNLFYLGNFLEGLETSIRLAHHIRQALNNGDGHNTLTVIKRLRALPDYSSHFDNHPPSGGKKQVAAENKGGRALPGGLNPQAL